MTTTRQRVRKALLLVSMLIFPITINYFSPYLIIQGGFEGVVAGSALIFLSQFLTALIFGRAFCGWLCPAGALQEAAVSANPKPTKPGLNRIKWLIWVPWAVMVLVGFISAGGIKQVNPLYFTETGISVAAPENYFIYLTVVALILILSFTVGRRAFCHSACWMAPFLVIGSWIKEKLAIPSLRLGLTQNPCIACGKCTQACPMSLPVQNMVETEQLFHSECILCATCADVCPKETIDMRCKLSR